MIKYNVLAPAGLLLLLGSPAHADSSQNYVTHSQTAKVLGTTFGGEIAAGNPPAVQSLQTQANITVLGQSLSALSASTNPPVEIGGTTYTEVYSFGKKVFTQSFFFGQNGPNQVSAGLSPTEIRVPFLIYPVVGPLLLEVAGGARFQANITATLTPNLGIPLNTSTLGVNLQALAQAAGFIEADLSLLFLRGGVGGQVYLVDGNLNVNGRLAFDGTPPIALVSAAVSFLNGSFYAFVDFTGLFGIGWSRLINHTLYSWGGYCFTTGGDTCPSD